MVDGWSPEWPEKSRTGFSELFLWFSISVSQNSSRSISRSIGTADLVPAGKFASVLFHSEIFVQVLAVGEASGGVPERFSLTLIARIAEKVTASVMWCQFL
jgi:hypothetical protein